MGNWKENLKLMEILTSENREGVTINGVYIPPIRGKGFIHDKYSCDCGWTDKGFWDVFHHAIKNSTHKMKQNW